MRNKEKIIRVTTVASSLLILLRGQLRFMSDHYEIVGVSANKKQLLDVETQEGIRTNEIPLTRQITPFKDLVCTFKLYQFLRKEKPFIVHTHTPKAGTVGLLAAFLARVPHRLHTIAGLPLMVHSGPKRIILNLVEKFTYAMATKIYPNSKGLETFVIKNGFAKKEKLKVIAHGSSNGIDIDVFNPSLISPAQKDSIKVELGILSSDRVLIYVGRLVNDKGIHELIEAFDQVSKKNKNVKLLLVGDYERDLDPILRKTERIMQNHDQIIMTGFKKDVRPYFAIAEALLFPSYREGFPNVVMQAGAMGIPTIASNINGCNEIIIPNENGMLIPPKNVEALIKAIERLLSHNNFEPKVCRELICSRYDKKLVWTELLREYQQLENNNNH